MARTKGGMLAQQQLQAQAQQLEAQGAPITLNALVNSASIQERFNKMLGDKTAGFMSSLLSVVNNSSYLKGVNPRTILACAATAASLDLPINPSLGQAYLVPYKGACQFQLGYKGVIQLFLRSGQAKALTMTPVYEGELKHWNRFTEEIEFGEKESDVVVGYYAMFELTNGFRKAIYCTRDEVIAHAKKFSKAYNSGPWQSDFDAMACKTVLLRILKTYAPLSIEMQKAFQAEEEINSMDINGDTETVDIDANEVDQAFEEALTEATNANS